MIKIGNWRNEVRFRDECSIGKVKEGLLTLAKSIPEGKLGDADATRGVKTKRRVYGKGSKRWG